MLILAVETSCDETSVAVVRDGRHILSNVVSSQIAIHAPYGGVVPEIASRQHVTSIVAVAELALDQAGISLGDIEGVAATRGPGLAGSLLVGFNFARALAFARSLPFAGVNHLHGHVYSVWLSTQDPAPPPPLLPMLALIVSGGHTELVLIRDHGSYQVVGRTLDDAAGEAFDKVARLLGLSYPGGPAIQRAAASTAGTALPRAWLPGTYDFSFSGLKTAVLHAVRAAHGEVAPAGNAPGVDPPAKTGEPLDQAVVAGIAGAFQDSVVDVLVKKTIAASGALGVASIAVVGGVAANAALRARMHAESNLPVYVARPDLATDNAAMIAAAAHYEPDAWDRSDINPSLQF